MTEPDVMRDHEVVSIFPFDEEQLDELLADARECVLMWGTKDGWPVGVLHQFFWKDGKFWITCTANRHRVSAIKRDPRVSVSVSAMVAPNFGPRGAATAKGRAVVHEDRETKDWFYRALAHKAMGDDKAAADHFVERLDSPLRVVIEVVPEKWITFDGSKSDRMVRGELPAGGDGAAAELGLGADAQGPRGARTRPGGPVARGRPWTPRAGRPP